MTSRTILRFAVAGTLASACLIQSACLMTAQDRTEIFEDESMPALIESAANPKPLVDAAPRAARSVVDVAVIDNGVDYTHPFLKKRVRYSESNGTITGAGIDVLGNDDWAHPNMIEGKFFAFGAEISPSRRIYDALDKPLEKIVELNEEFGKILDKELTDTRALDGTMFRKVSSKNLSLYGALGYLARRVEIEKESAELESVGVELKPEDYPTLSSEAKKAYWGSMFSEASSRTYFNTPWRLGRNGRPATMVEIHANVGTKAFLEALDRAWTAFDKKFQFESAYLEPYVTYVFDQSSESTQSAGIKETRRSSIGELATAHFEFLNPLRTSDPLFDFQEVFCGALDNADYAKFGSLAGNDERREFIENRFKSIEARVAEGTEFLLNDPSLPPAQRSALKGRKKKNPLFLAWIKEKLTARQIESLTCDTDLSKHNYPYKNLQISYADRTVNPLLFDGSNTQSHGTHVSGIVASQSPDARIVPVRVITESRSSKKEDDQKIINWFMADFTAWLSDPVVMAALHEKFAGPLGLDPESTTQEDVHKAYLEYFNDEFPKLFSENKLDFYFVRQVKDAVEKVGEARIKLANVSLGTSISKTIVSPDDSAEQQLANLSMYWLYEFFKDSVRASLQSKASKTLFVIAAGNDGSWLDGKSKSALPCDLTSTLLDRKATELGRPRQAVDNVLCVASMDYRGDLSSFTNLVLTKVPLVVSIGESALSSVKVEDCSGVDERVKKEVGTLPLPPTMAMNRRQLEEFLKQKGVILPQDTPAEIETKIEAERMKEVSSLALLQQASVVSSNHRCLVDEPTGVQRMSGTSMASPAVAGYFARLLSNELAQLGVTQEDVFDLPAYAPSALIKRYSETAPTINDGSLISNLRMIKDIRPYGGDVSVQPSSLKLGWGASPFDMITASY